MSAVVVEEIVDRPIGAVWQVVSDVAGHRLPLTTVHTDPGPPGVGWRFRGITALGPVKFTDAMVVTRWSPPSESTPDRAEYAVVKTGRPLSGWAEVALEAVTASSTRVVWREEIVLHPHALGRLVAPLTDRAVQAMFRRAVAEMLARA